MLITRRFALGAAGFGLVWWTCSRTRGVGKVKVNFRIIRYTEADAFIELAWEPLEGKPPVAYVPSPRRWRAEMPDWARDRREEIFAEIKDQTTFMNFTWQEYD